MDIALELQDGYGDLAMDGADLATDEGLQTAILLSLFTDRRVASKDLPPEESDRRGWWGDVGNRVEGDEWGSRLWLLSREKSLNSVAVRAEEYAEEALRWLVADGVASTVNATARLTDSERLELEIRIGREAGEVVLRYAYNWHAQIAET